VKITNDFIHTEIANQSYEISIHADNERLCDELTVSQMESVLKKGEIIEYYESDIRGESCLVYDRTDNGTDVHIVCGRNWQGHLFIITVYIPKMPKWLNPRLRNR
jgi:hypothetical protein